MAAAAAVPQPSIWHIIMAGDLAEVQRRVEADSSVMEERNAYRRTPLMWAIYMQQSAIALWLIEHRGDHDLNAADDEGWCAIHFASDMGPLEIVQQLVAVGADVTAMTNDRETALKLAAWQGHADIVAFLLTLPAVCEGIDSIDVEDYTSLSSACGFGHFHIVRLLLDAGANPTIPQGDHSPLRLAADNHHHATIPLLRRAIAEPQRPRLLFKARSIVDATFAIRKAQHDNRAKPASEIRRRMVEAAPEYLQGRVGRGEQLPTVHVTEEEDNDDEEEEEQAKRRATLAYVLGMAGGPTGDGLPREVFTELMELMVPRWDQPAARRP